MAMKYEDSLRPKAGIVRRGLIGIPESSLQFDRLREEAMASRQCTSIQEFMACFRASLLSTPLADRQKSFESTLKRAGLRALFQDGFYSLSSDRGTCSPRAHWKQLANMIVRLDEESLPCVVAYGAPELFTPVASSLDRILDNAAVGNYRIEPILFGSVCWLYNYEGMWHIATKRTADAKNIKIRPDGPSFSVAIEEAAKMPLDELTKKMKPNYTYGFVMHNRKIHMFAYREFESKIWHVSTIDNITGIAVKHMIGIPEPPLIFQSMLHFDESRKLLKADVLTTPTEEKWSQELVDEREKNGIEICHTAKVRSSGVEMNPELKEEAIVKVLRARIAEICQESTESLCRSDNNFGFVLRTTNQAATFPDDHIVIKSPLYTFIEGHIGKIIPIRMVIGRLLYAYPEEQTKFCQIFPHLTDLFRLARKEVERLMTYIKRYHETECTEEPSRVAALHKMVLEAIGTRNFTDVAILNELLNPRGKAKTSVIESLLSMLPSEESTLGRMHSIVSQEACSPLPTDFPVLK